MRVVQLSTREVSHNKMELKASTAQSRITELEGLQQAGEVEVTQLKRDKVLLVEHVADLQKKVRAVRGGCVGVRQRV